MERGDQTDFDCTVETICHEILSANKDRIENHEDRITRSETHAGMASA
jgi:hypothetical protein